MSHTYVLAIARKGIEGKALGDEAHFLMSPFDENMKVPEYMTPCSCVGWNASREAHILMQNELGSWDGCRKLFEETFPELFPKNLTGLQPEVIAETLGKRERFWRMSFYEPRRNREKEILELRSDKDKPDQKCKACHGAGEYKTTYNLRSRWDWFRIGGRWDGVTAGVKAEDTENGFNFSNEHESLEKNTALVSSLIKRGQIPFAIVTPIGDWIEKGEMGYWGFVMDEKVEEEWITTAIEVMNRYADHWAIGLDVHI